MFKLCYYSVLLLLQIHSRISCAESTDNTRGYFTSCVVFENNDWNKMHVLPVKPWNKVCNMHRSCIWRLLFTWYFVGYHLLLFLTVLVQVSLCNSSRVRTHQSFYLESTQEVRAAFFFCSSSNSYPSFVLSKLHACITIRYCPLKHESIVNAIRQLLLPGEIYILIQIGIIFVLACLTECHKLLNFSGLV